jgi:integrase/recombinase XerD
MKITAMLRKDQPDKNNLCKIVLRVRQGTTSKYLTTAYKVLKSQFKKGKVFNHPDAVRINSELQREIGLLESETTRSNDLFSTYANNHIDFCEGSGSRSKATIVYYNSELGKFTRFAGEVKLTAITPDLIKRYIVHLKQQGLAHNTVKKSLKFLNTLLNLAVKEDMIDKNPCKKVESIPYKQTVREYLTVTEVSKISSLEIDTANPLYKIRAWFLIQCYTGLRYSDLEKATAPDILTAGRITIATEKTGEIISQPLSDTVRNLISQSGTFNISNQDYNRYLKLLAALAGITKTLTSHVGRHTFGMRLIERGADIYDVQHLLGHSDIKSTKIYARLRNPRLDKTMENFGY